MSRAWPGFLRFKECVHWASWTVKDADVRFIVYCDSITYGMPCQDHKIHSPDCVLYPIQRDDYVSSWIPPCNLRCLPVRVLVTRLILIPLRKFWLNWPIRVVVQQKKHVCKCVMTNHVKSSSPCTCQKHCGDAKRFAWSLCKQGSKSG